MVITYRRFEAPGADGLPVPNTLVRSRDRANHLCVLLPGLGYTCHGPLFYYLTRYLLLAGVHVLRVEYNYLHRFGEGTEGYLHQDVAAVCRSMFTELSYRRVTLVGKSMGTLAIGPAVRELEPLRDAWQVWIGPLLKRPDVRDSVLASSDRGLVVIGTADHSNYDAGFLARARAAGVQVMELEGGDHALESVTDVPRSLRLLETAVEAAARFVLR
jgi:hypothetical protein